MMADFTRESLLSKIIPNLPSPHLRILLISPHFSTTKDGWAMSKAMFHLSYSRAADPIGGKIRTEINTELLLNVILPISKAASKIMSFLASCEILDPYMKIKNSHFGAYDPAAFRHTLWSFIGPSFRL